MNRPLRYTLFALVFLFGFTGFLVGTSVMKITMLILAVFIGIVADGIDNLQDRPFQQYNELHDHYKK